MDIKLGSNGIVFNGYDLQMTQSSDEFLAQRLTITFKTTLGKWFLNTKLGVDYFGKVFGKNRSKTAIDLMLKKVIESDYMVDKIISFTSTVDNTVRSYSCEFTVKVIGTKEEIQLKILTTSSGFRILTKENQYILV